jgi:hypothetical protein
MPGHYRVTNRSSNPISLGKQPLGHGDQGTVRPGDHIDFIASADRSDSTLVFLKFILEKADDVNVDVAQSSKELPPTLVKNTKVSTGDHVVGTEVPKLPFGPSAARLMEATDAAQKRAESSLETGVGRDSAMQTQSAQATPFRLTLCGSALEEAHSQDEWHLEGKEEGLTVGRNHQPSMFAVALRAGVAPYISREHFRIDRCQLGACSVISLSGNPLWRVRGMEKTKLMRDEPALPLASGDALLLFTGARDGTPDGPGSFGLLYFRFHQASRPELGLIGRAASSVRSLREAVASPGESTELPPAPQSLQHTTPPSTPPSRQRRASWGACALITQSKDMMPPQLRMPSGGSTPPIAPLRQVDASLIGNYDQVNKTQGVRSFLAGDRVLATDNITSNNEVPESIKKGWCGTVLEVDEDGDIYIDFGAGGEQWVLRGDLHKLAKRAGHQEESYCRDMGATSPSLLPGAMESLRHGASDPVVVAAPCRARQAGAADVLKVPVLDVPLPVESSAREPPGLPVSGDPSLDVDAMDALLAHVRGDAFAASGFRFRAPRAAPKLGAFPDAP